MGIVDALRTAIIDLGAEPPISPIVGSRGPTCSARGGTFFTLRFISMRDRHPIGGPPAGWSGAEAATVDPDTDTPTDLECRRSFAAWASRGSPSEARWQAHHRQDDTLLGIAQGVRGQYRWEPGAHGGGIGVSRSGSAISRWNLSGGRRRRTEAAFGMRRLGGMG